MTLSTAFGRVCNAYPEVTAEALPRHPLAQFVRTALPPLVHAALGQDPRYRVKGSVGRGVHWARVPWLGIFDRTVTTSAQRGYYVVYLWCADGSGCYLALVHGVEALRQQAGRATGTVLQPRLQQARQALGLAGPPPVLDLRLGRTRGLAADYERAAVLACPYSTHAWPPEAQWHDDLHGIMHPYRRLVER